MRSPRGRMATRGGFDHMKGVKPDDMKDVKMPPDGRVDLQLPLSSPGSADVG